MEQARAAAGVFWIVGGVALSVGWGLGSGLSAGLVAFGVWCLVSALVAASAGSRRRA
jgi:hypothetical protein